MVTAVDLRCPVVHRRLFARLRMREASIVEGNLIEVACDECRKIRRKQGDEVRLVLHRFNVIGVCVETEVVP